LIGCHHPPWSSAKAVLNRPPWSGDIIIWRRHWWGGLIRGRRPGRFATIFHEWRQQSDIIVHEQLQQCSRCTIDKEVTL
jgi:hypothetical protein